MKITNQFQLPEFVSNALTKDTYSRGSSSYSITQLIDSPRIRILQHRYKDEMEQDVVDFLWSRFGTAVHNMFEDNVEADNLITEERLFQDIEGWNISGAIDLQEVNADGSIGVKDYKVTSVWSVIFDKEEWHKQLNAYAWLVRHSKNVPVKSLQIIAILRDWQRRKAQEDEGYPLSPIHIVDIPLWSDQEQDLYIEQRINIHQQAEFAELMDDALPLCSDEERWKKEDKYAVKKKGNKRALRVFSSKKEADDYQSNSGQNLVIEERRGASTRCVQNWCRVNQWCSQYQKENTSARD